MINVVIDIEAIPSQQPWVRDYIEATVTHPGQMKKPETIAKWVEEDKPETVEEAMNKCVFDGAMNQIICIGLAIDGSPVETYSGDEQDILRNFYGALDGLSFDTKWIGHNISGFDLRVLRQRSAIMNIKPPACVPFDAKPWDNVRVYDTMVQWDAKNFTKLDKLAKAFGITGKSIDGSQVYGMWKDGKHQEIASYCAADVEMTRKVYKRMVYGN